MSRALWQFLQGNWAEAWAYHPLIFVMFGLVPIAFLVIRRRLKVPVTPTLWTGLVLYLGVWLIRWQAGTLPPV